MSVKDWAVDEPEIVFVESEDVRPPEEAWVVAEVLDWVLESEVLTCDVVVTVEVNVEVAPEVVALEVSVTDDVDVELELKVLEVGLVVDVE